MSKREQLVVNQMVGQDGLAFAPARSKRVSTIRTTAGAQTLLAAETVDRVVHIMLTVDTTFAAGDGAAPIVSIGETGTATKFVNAKTTGTAGDKVMYDGVLLAGKALILTGTAATGTTSTGATTVSVIAA